jgi:transposase-like protein
MSTVDVELEVSNDEAGKSLKVWLLEKIRDWVNGLLEAEMAEHLQRGRYEPVRTPNANYRNGRRPRKLNLFGLGRVQIDVPRDRAGTFRSQLLPERKGQDAELEAMIAECFLAGLSTRDISRISAKHFGKRYDSKQVSRIVERASAEMDAWRTRSLADRRYKFLFMDGANFKVRINHRIEKQSFCVVLGVSEEQESFEVLAITMGDRERADLWGDVFTDLAHRGLDGNAVELGIMDGLPGLEEVFRKHFRHAQTQRCQIHAKRNALRRVRKSDQDEFKLELNGVFYALNEADARKNFRALKEKWSPRFPGAVEVIERDLDSLLRFYAFDKVYWASIRTTNPIERLNKEFKRRSRAMEVTGGETATYRIMTYVAMTIEYQWSFHRLPDWAKSFASRCIVYTHNAA